MLYYDLVTNVSTEQYMCTSCNNNDGVACVTDLIPFVNILFGDENLIIHANTTSRQEKFGSGLDINVFLHNSSVSTCTFRKR